MHCEPNRRAIGQQFGPGDRCGVDATLSAPARSSTSTSSTARTPPPTVSGMNTCSAVRWTTSSMVARPDERGRDVEERQLVGALGS